MTPTVTTSKTSKTTTTTHVSWHADSCLEHYSTIAVYQMLVDEPSSERNTTTEINNDQSNDHYSTNNNEWSIGLRVAHYAEGPKVNPIVQQQQQRQQLEQPQTIAPPIAVSLPNNSVYYLLDDFNHHHQHTVMEDNNHSKCCERTMNHKNNKSRNKQRRQQKSNSSTETNYSNNNNNTYAGCTRYSLTFRLLRESHNVYHMIEKCHRCIVQQFHKKSIKVYKYEQLLLNELESEWLRQFYIQGSQHYTSLWDDWGTFIIQLWDDWNQLETRTYQIVQLLQYAAEGKCYMNDSTNNTINESGLKSKVERKLREKRKKALQTMLDFEKREGEVNDETFGTQSNETLMLLPSLYECMVSMLEDRARMRELWLQRERDPIFKRLEPQARPLPLPILYRYVHFNSKDNNIDNCKNDDMYTTTTDRKSQTEIYGLSPMPGTPNELRELVNAVRQWGKAFQSGNRNDLPTLDHVLYGGDARTATTKTTATAVEGTSTKLLDQRTISVKNDMDSIDNDQSNSMPFDWIGWQEHDFGLEMQHPWSEALMNGTKRIEVRRYDLPSSLLGRKIYIIETPKGTDGVSGIVDNYFEFHSNNIADTSSKECRNKDDSTSSNQRGPRIVGWCKFSSATQYKTKEDFHNDEKYHLVTKTSTYGWEANNDALFGWKVDVCRRIGKLQDDPQFTSGIRRYRSLFQLKCGVNLPVNERNGNLSQLSKSIVSKQSKNKKKSNSKQKQRRQMDSTGSAHASKKRRF